MSSLGAPQSVRRHTHTHTHVRACMQAARTQCNHTPTKTYTCICRYLHTYIRRYIHTYICSHLYLQLYRHIHICVYEYSLRQMLWIPVFSQLSFNLLISVSVVCYVSHDGTWFHVSALTVLWHVGNSDWITVVLLRHRSAGTGFARCWPVQHLPARARNPEETCSWTYVVLNIVNLHLEMNPEVLKSEA